MFSVKNTNYEHLVDVKHLHLFILYGAWQVVMSFSLPVAGSSFVPNCNSHCKLQCKPSMYFVKHVSSVYLVLHVLSGWRRTVIIVSQKWWQENSKLSLGLLLFSFCFVFFSFSFKENILGQCESSGSEPVNIAAEERASLGDISCGNSSLEPEDPGKKSLHVFRDDWDSYSEPDFHRKGRSE